MKKVLYVLTLASALLLSSCAKEEPGGTAVEQMAGQWYVEVVGCDADGSVLYEDEDLFGLGRFILLTYNTNANSSSEMYIDDQANFWEFKVRVDINQNDMTFSNAKGTKSEVVDYEIETVISNGSIVKNGTKTSSGRVADAIEFDIAFEDDDYAGVYYDHLHIRGWRYTGFTEDD